MDTQHLQKRYIVSVYKHSLSPVKVNVTILHWPPFDSAGELWGTCVGVLLIPPTDYHKVMDDIRSVPCLLNCQCCVDVVVVVVVVTVIVVDMSSFLWVQW